MEQQAELKQFRAMELECSKWEAKEDRQIRQLERRLFRLELDSQRRLTFQKKASGARSNKQIHVATGLASLPSWSDSSSFDSDKSKPPMKQLPAGPTHRDISTEDANAADKPVAKQHDQNSDSADKEATCSSTEQESGDVMQPQQFLQQLPPLPKFNGEQT